MHPTNRIWLSRVQKRFPQHFVGASVLEIGSYNVNGTARDYFPKARKYVGVDREAGRDVDIVAEAKATSFVPGEFDTLVYLSVFEHDPEWAKGFEHNLRWVRDGGLIILCWGAEGNLKHAPFPWAIVPVLDFMKASREWPIGILEALFEHDWIAGAPPGIYDVLAIKTS